MSKQPLVTTSFFLPARRAARHASNASHAMIFSRKFIRLPIAKFLLPICRARPQAERQIGGWKLAIENGSFPRAVNAHDAAEEIDRAHVGQPKLAHLGRHA